VHWNGVALWLQAVAAARKTSPIEILMNPSYRTHGSPSEPLGTHDILVQISDGSPAYINT
jgi:hypothetical protein